MKQKTNRKKVGDIGENIATKFLIKKGFRVLSRNYLKPFGEIDIIAEIKGTLHFIEVKTVSCENIETFLKKRDFYRPEDNVHAWKLSRISKTIQVYLSEKHLSEDVEWVFDVVAIYLDVKTKKARVSFLEDIIL
ncbi:MAG: YraN family protein [Candidatus Pacebacteria bacterium]|nr:YraN family protein [Candidatus Paceibacterota bacterium]